MVTFTVRRRIGDSFDGRSDMTIQAAVHLLDQWMTTAAVVKTRIQLVDETTDRALVTVERTDDGWTTL